MKSYKLIKRRLTSTFKPVKKFISTHRLRLFVASAILLVIITTSARAFLPTPTPEPTLEPEIKTVSVFDPTSEANIDIPATVINHANLTLVAQSPGPVASIQVKPGQKVYRGQALVQQSSAYSGGNLAAVGVASAAKSLELAKTSYQSTRDIVDRNRELADRNRDNSNQLRDISKESIDQTKSLLDLNREIITKLEADIAATTDPATKLALQSQLLGFKSSLSQTESGLKNLEYSTNSDNPPSTLTNLTRDLVYSSTELQLKSAQLQQELAELGVRQAAILLSQTQITAPISGTVERIFVDQGQYLNPGTPAVVITGNKNLQLTATLSPSVYLKLNLDQPLTIVLENQDPLIISDYYISSVPTRGGLHELTATLPNTSNSSLYESAVVTIRLPLTPSTTSESITIPLDTVFITSNSAFIYTLENSQATKRVVELGIISGDSVEIFSGINPSDQIIRDRSVTEGQQVQAQ